MSTKCKTSRIMALLLTMCMVFTMLPITAFAGYEDGTECFYCGHYHWDDYCCADCGACSEDCDYTCYVDTHCVNCGKCYLDCDFICQDCGRCDDCVGNSDKHCEWCRKCVGWDGDATCSGCNLCEDCAGNICDDCGFCDSCIDSDEGLHCLECGACSSTTTMCKGAEELGSDMSKHCEDCCELCDECGVCLIYYEEQGGEVCSECGKCAECCEALSNAWGCDCGMCVESAEWDDHFCEQCGACYDGVEQCDICNLCIDCCESNSECSYNMCAENDEYEDHFCIDCGSCFCDVERCEDCDDMRCLDCCRLICEDAGCDCGNICCSDSDFDEHIISMHSSESDGGHTEACPQNIWSVDSSNHYHACRFCDEDGHVTGKAPHTFDANTGKCTVCGYKTGAKLFVTRQPKDVFVKVPDINSTEDIYHEVLKTFSVKAQGEGELSYQWYNLKYDYSSDSLKWTALEDDNEFGISGSTTNKLVHFVPGDACYNELSFKCEITDENGDTVESDVAKIHASHVYKEAENVENEANKSYSYIYFSADSKDNDKYQKSSKGHKWTCVGEGCDAARNKIEPHRFTTTVVKATYYTAQELTDFYKRVCMDCGYRTYERKHIHEFKLPDWTAEGGQELIEKEATPRHHVLHCTVGSCDQTKEERHSWMWKIASWPENNTTTGEGAVMRECSDCQYWENDFKLIAATDGVDEELSWDTTNLFVRVSSGFANTPVVKPGETLYFTPDKIEDKVCTGFKEITLRKDNLSTNDVNGLTSCNPTQTSNGKWKLTVPTNAPKGGIIDLVPKYEACSHSKTPVLVRQKAPGCISNGYTGDKVCPDCDKIMEVGDPIAARGYHGELTPVAGTIKAAAVGSCTSGEKGYSGDSKCEDCGQIIEGKKTVAHGNESDWELRDAVAATCTTEGYSGDYHCNYCDKIMKKGHILGFEHKNSVTKNEKEATCTENGYTGDTYCNDCNMVVAYGNSTPLKGHKWDEGTVTKAPTKDSVGVTTYTCEICSATKTSNIAKLGAVKKYNVRINPTTNGSVTADKEKAAAGELVKLTVTPASGYELDSLQVLYSMGAEVTLNPDNSFTMPNEDAIVNATFRKIGVAYSTKVEVISIIESAITPELKDAGFSSVGDIEEKLTEVAVSYGYTSGNTAIYEAKLMISTDGGNTWAEATKDTFPADGKLSVVIPYPAGTDKNYDFIVAHMFATGANGKTPGDFETPAVTKADDGLHVTFTGLSPVSVSWKKTASGGSSSGGSSGGGSSSVAKYTLTFETNGGSKVNSVSKASGTSVDLAGYKPTKDGFEFAGWYSNKALTEKVTSVKLTKNTTVYAKWTEKAAEQPAASFTDVPADAYYADAVKWAVDEGITSGTSAALFNPNGICTRAQAVTFLWRAAGSPKMVGVMNPFSDLKADSYYYDAVLWAVEKSITFGTSSTTFSPDAECTRAQIVTFLWRSAGNPVVNYAMNFKDVSADSYYAEAVRWAVSEQITAGTSANAFSPNASCTRAQIVTFLWRGTK